MTRERPWMTAGDAASALRVSRATLYAYVSRGYVRSQATSGSSRERRYSRDDVERLRRRTEERRNPDRAAAHALQWGMPILESSIALIDDGRLYYRGHDALALARSRSIQEVASLIWTGGFDKALPVVDADVRRNGRGAADLPFVTRAQSALAVASAADPLAADLRPATVALTGWTILHLLTRVAAGNAAAAPTVDQTLGAVWGVGRRGTDVLRSALILCADHELNVSSFTARCVASAGSSPYGVAIAGLAALQGPRHGGASARVESMLASMRRERDLRRAVADRLRRGDSIDGFGHPLYPHGDPRASLIVEMLRERYARSAELAFVDAFAEATASATREKPNLDYALAAMARVVQLPAGAPLMLFAIGRTIGWIGHAIEQYETKQLIRPRAKYVGAPPGAS